MIYAFAEFELDDATYELRRDGRAMRLEPKVFDVLRLLVRHRERVVTKAEFLETVWPGEHVTESALPRAVAAVRKALGDDRVRQTWVRTVHGRGYQFVGAVRETGTREPAAAEDARPRGPASPPSLPRGVGLVGREAPLARMTAALEEAEAGRGRLLLLFGEPGIGKTRTAEALLEIALERGFEVIAGRCYEGEGAPAFWPWVQILRACIEESEDQELASELGPHAATVAHLVPELAARLREPPTPLPSGDEARFLLFDGLTRFLLRRSESKPLALLIDDLHWADRASALLVRFFTGEMRSHRVLLIGAYREVELRRGSALGEVLVELSRAPHSERIALRGLDRRAVAALARESAGAAPDDALVDAIAEITEGNPFFVNETLRWLRSEAGAEAGGDRGAWDAALPQGLRDVVGRRLDRLSEECNRVLTRAAVVGHEFALPVLARLASVPPGALLETLDEAVRARIVVESPERPGAYGFSHALIQQTILEELPTPVRVRLHREVGHVLEELHGAGSESHLDALAHHFFQAAPGGDVDKAVAYAERAGRAAQKLLAYEEAAAWFVRALQALDLRVPDDEVRRCELLLALGTAYEEAGERKRMREAFSQAAERARGLERPDLLALAAIGFAGRTERGTPDTGMRALLEEALAALGSRQPGLRARLLDHLVGTPPYDDDMETRLAMAREAAELGRASGDPVAHMAGLGARAWSLMGPDWVDERLELADELLDLAERTGSTEARFTGLEARLRSLLVLGDMQRADREIERYVALADELRQPVFRLIAHLYLVARALSTGRFEDVEALIERGSEFGRASEHPARDSIFWGQRIWLRIVRGDVEELPGLLAPMGQAVWVPGSGSYVLLATRALEALVSGREPDARRLLREAASHEFRDLPRNEHWLTTMAMYATLCASLGDAPRAAALHERLLPYASLNTLHDTLRADFGPVDTFLGLLARTRGRADLAVDHLEAALAACERMGARPHHARAGAELADLLRERGAPGDAARAGELERNARATARELRMPRLELRIPGSRAGSG